MSASRGIRRPAGPPTLAWLEAQCIRMPCLIRPDLGDCWLWQRGKVHDGYGRVSIEGRDVLAHRAAYEVAKEPVPCWLTLDHLCRQRACINPAHLEPVTQFENIARGDAPSAFNQREGKCKRGHVIVAGGRGARCLACRADRQREWYERKQAALGKPVGERRSA